MTDALRHRRLADTGRRGEDVAHRYLRGKGYTVVARNWRPPTGPGEIDIIAWDGPTLVFVEVKARTSDDWSAPERNVDAEKTRALQRAAASWLRLCPAETPRFDVIAITGKSVQHFADAFPATARG
jgi:putative endonuclease